MKNWKSIANGVLAFVAVTLVGGSAIDDRAIHSGTIDNLVMAGAVFLSIVFLHWLAWDFIVPDRQIAPFRFTSYLRRHPRSGFFKGTLGFGYTHLIFYCVILSGILNHPSTVGSLHTLEHDRVGFLVIGFVLVGMSTAARLREVFLALRASSASPIGPS